MTVTLELAPSTLAALCAESEADAIAELRLVAAVKLFELGRLSSGAAAELAGLERLEFLLRLKEFGVHAIQGTAADLVGFSGWLRAWNDPSSPVAGRSQYAAYRTV